MSRLNDSKQFSAFHLILQAFAIIEYFEEILSLQKDPEKETLKLLSISFKNLQLEAWKKAMKLCSMEKTILQFVAGRISINNKNFDFGNIV